MNSPCGKCFDRKLRCHAQCERYQAFRKALDEQIERRSRENEKRYVSRFALKLIDKRAREK